MSDEPRLSAAEVAAAVTALCRVGVAAVGAPLSRTPASFDPDGDAPLPRPDRRAGAPALVDDPAVAVDDESEPVDPADPVVSANATGIAATAEPTPNAIANAPTRPTYRVLCPTDLRIRSGDTRNALTAAAGTTLMSRDIAPSGRHHQQTGLNYGRFTDQLCRVCGLESAVRTIGYRSGGGRVRRGKVVAR